MMKGLASYILPAMSPVPSFPETHSISAYIFTRGTRLDVDLPNREHYRKTVLNLGSVDRQVNLLTS